MKEEKSFPFPDCHQTCFPSLSRFLPITLDYSIHHSVNPSYRSHYDISSPYFIANAGVGQKERLQVYSDAIEAEVLAAHVTSPSEEFSKVLTRC